MDKTPVDVLDINGIMNLLPHRYPFLLVDKVSILEKGVEAVGIKNVTFNEPFFQGHFPGNPIMPGVLTVEALAQTAAVVVLHDAGKKMDVLFMSIESAKFRRPLRPGDQAELHVLKVQNRRNIFRFSGEVRVDGALCTEVLFTAMILESNR